MNESPSSIAAVDDRVEELLGRLTLEDKAGLLFQAMALVEPGCIPECDGEPLLPGMMHDLVVTHHITHVNVMNVLDPASQARWKNAVDVLAATTHAGIPVTVSSDPRSAVDIATEPRWSRISGTWGGDPELTSALGAAWTTCWPATSTSRTASPIRS